MGPLDQLNAGIRAAGHHDRRRPGQLRQGRGDQQDGGTPSIEFYSEIGGTGATNGVAVCHPDPGERDHPRPGADRLTRPRARSGRPTGSTVEPGPLLAATYQVPAAALGKIFGARQFTGLLVSHKGGQRRSPRRTTPSGSVPATDTVARRSPRRALPARRGRFGQLHRHRRQVWTPDTGRFSPATAIEEGASATAGDRRHRRRRAVPDVPRQRRQRRPGPAGAELRRCRPRGRPRSTCGCTSRSGPPATTRSASGSSTSASRARPCGRTSTSSPPPAG